MNESIFTPSAAPPVAQLIEEFKRCGTYGTALQRHLTSEQTRDCYWDGQDDSGKKLDRRMPDGQPAFPWNGASDTRVYLADEVCNENAGVLCSAFWRSVLEMQGVGPEDMEQSSMNSVFLNWLIHSKLVRELDEEVELAAQYLETYGWVGLHITWDREVQRKLQPVTLAQLQDISASVAERIQGADLSKVPADQARNIQNLIQFADLILDADREEEAVEAAQEIYTLFAEQNLPPALREDIAEISKTRARKVVRELRETGSSEVPMPYLCRNVPRIASLKPFRDLILPYYTTSVQSCPFPMIRRWMTEVELRAQVLADGWDKSWVDAVIKTKGQQSTWTSTGFSNNQQTAWAGRETQTELIEVVYAYYKQIDPDGITSLGYCVFSPHITRVEPSSSVTAGKSGVLNYAHGRYPLVVIRRERRDRSITDSRSTPELLLTTQQEEKVQRDSIIDLTSIAVVPPLNVPRGTMRATYKFGPATQNEVTPGREPNVMNIPTRGAPIAFEVLEMIGNRVARQHGRTHESVPPALQQIIKEPYIRRFLLGWSEALDQAFQLSVQFAPELVERVTGSPPPANLEDLSQGVDYVLTFDPSQLSPELMEKKLEAFSRLLPEDMEGVVDKGALVKAKAMMIDPRLARGFILDKAVASEKIRAGVKADLVAMFAGVEADYVDASNDPTAPTKLATAKEIIAKNPQFQQALDPQLLSQLLGQAAGQGPVPIAPGAQGEMPGGLAGGGMPGAQSKMDPLFSSLVDAYIKNLDQGVAQQKNKQIGRTGVKPVTA